MIRRKDTTQKALSISKGEVIPLEKLDRLLDVPTPRFEDQVSRLVKRMKRQAATIAIELPLHVAEPASMSGFRSVPRQYQRELAKLPRMDRAEEFRMARRYEFLQARAAGALIAAGLPSEQAERLVKRPCSEIRAAVPTGLKAAVGEHVETALHELGDLRTLYVEGALYLVLGMVARYRNSGVDVADLVQEGNASLFQAIEGFDWRRDVRFKTYAQYWVHQAILKVLYDTSRTVRIPVWVQKALKKMQRFEQAEGRTLTIEELGERMDMPAERVDELRRVRRYAVSLDMETGGEDGGWTLGQGLSYDDEVPVPETVVEGDLSEALAEVMEELPDREAMILRRRYGLGGVEPETLGEIAQDMGITAERVRQLQNAALRRLKKPGQMQRLAMFADA